MYIAVEGCCHGELDKIYETIQFIEKKENIKVDLLLCCGDFQSVRDEADLACMACPDKYKSMQDFWKYYKGEKSPPVLTIFIGGNHEASNHLQELPFGGWVANNIYYMGYAGVINYKGVRIGGLSGIYKQYNYNKPHYEAPPYNGKSIRSVYHVRQQDVKKLMHINSPIDIMMSHDWPNGVVEYGDKQGLLRKKKFFAQDIENKCLGSDPAWQLLTTLKPTYWFSGHLHVKFAAVIPHNETTNAQSTKFLSLDKCLPNRNFLQILDVPTQEDKPNKLLYDAEWIAILKHKSSAPMPIHNSPKGVSETEIKNVLTSLKDNLQIPDNFKVNDSCVYEVSKHNKYKPVELVRNPQTVEFCEKFDIVDPMDVIIEGGVSDSFNTTTDASFQSFSDYSNITTDSAALATSINDDEINIESDDDMPLAESITTKDSSDNIVLVNTDSPSSFSRMLPPVQNNTSTPAKIGSQGSSDSLSSIPFSPMGAGSPSSDSVDSKSEPELPLPGSLAAIIKNAQNAYLSSVEEKNKQRQHEMKMDTETSQPTPAQSSSTPKRAFKRRNSQFYSSQSEDD